MGSPILRYEAGQTPYPFEALTSTDNLTFSSSFAPWSNAAGAEPVVSPYGLLTGGAVTVNTGTDHSVSVATLTAMMPGAAGASATTGIRSVTGGNLAALRATTSPGSVDQTHAITSLTVDDAGTLAAVAGVEGLAFSETRGAAGGPPYIPVGSIEIGQVRRVGRGDAEVTAGEIYTVPNLHVEFANYPVYDINYATGEVVFAAELPLIHTADAPKLVYARGSTPLFAPLGKVSDWVPAESTYSITSTDTYDGPVGSATSSLGQASFTAQLVDGITDSFLLQKGKTVWMEFRPDRDKLLPKMLTQGVLGVSRAFPAGGGSFSASCTVTPSVESLDVRS